MISGPLTASLSRIITGDAFSGKEEEEGGGDKIMEWPGNSAVHVLSNVIPRV